MSKLLAVSLFLACLVPLGAFAQDAPQRGGNRGGNRGGQQRRLDPAQRRQHMLEYMKEQLAATDEEWQVIEPRLSVVYEKQQAERELSGGRGGMRRGPESEPVAEVAAVEKAIESKDAAAIKTSLEALRKKRADQEAETTKAKEALREVLSVGQEARLVLMGTLD